MGPCLQNAQLAGYPNELPYKLLEFVHFRLWLCVCCDFNPQLRAFGALTSAFKLKLWSFVQKGCLGKKKMGAQSLKTVQPCGQAMLNPKLHALAENA